MSEPCLVRRYASPETWDTCTEEWDLEGCEIPPQTSKVNGYVRQCYGGVPILAHRHAWEAVNGPVPEGLELDHLCRNRACCKVSHLQVVTHRVNGLRGEGVCAKYARKVTCDKGHQLVAKPGSTRRYCPECRDQWDLGRERAGDRETHRASCANYRANNREKRMAYQREYRAKKREAQDG